MSKKLIYIAFTMLILSLIGCDKLQSNPNTLVLDIQAIADATGQAATIKQQVEIANNDLTAQLKTILEQLNEQLALEKEKLGKKPSASEQQKLQQLTAQANQKMQQAKTIANQKSQQYQMSLIQQLREKVQPIAEKIARERRAVMVTTLDNSTLWYNPEIDITDEIIAEMRAKPASINAANSDTTAPEATSETK